MIIDKFEGINYSDLSDEQLDSLSKKELLNKFISDDVDLVNSYTKKRVKSILSIHTILLLGILSIYHFGLIGLFFIIPLCIVIWVDFYFKKSLKWSVITLKTNIVLFRGNGDFCVENDYIFEHHLNRLNGVDIGDLY